MPDRTAHHLNDKTQTRFIIVKETREISRGRSQNGREYVMWQIIATKPDGVPIDANLRSFEDLPRGELLEVAVTPFVSEQWGTSYTVARKDKSELHRKVEELQARIERLESILNVTDPVSVANQTSAPPPPPSTPETPPPPPTVAQHTTPGNGDVPF